MTTFKLTSAASALVIAMLAFTPAYAVTTEHNSNDGHSSAEHKSAGKWFDHAENTHSNNDGHSTAEHDKQEKHSLDVHTKKEHSSNDGQAAQSK